MERSAIRNTINVNANINAIELLKADHERVKSLFAHIETVKSFEEKRRVFHMIKQELDVHAYIEETVLYPMFRVRPEFKGLIEEAYDEHQDAKTLLLEISSSQNRDRNDFENRVDELIDSVEHHVEEEENELFPKIKKVLSDDELLQIGTKLIDAKNEFALKGRAATAA